MRACIPRLAAACLVASLAGCGWTPCFPPDRVLAAADTNAFEGDTHFVLATITADGVEARARNDCSDELVPRGPGDLASALASVRAGLWREATSHGLTITDTAAAGDPSPRVSVRLTRVVLCKLREKDVGSDFETVYTWTTRMTAVVTLSDTRGRLLEQVEQTSSSTTRDDLTDWDGSLSRRLKDAAEQLGYEIALYVRSRSRGRTCRATAVR